MAGYLSDAWIEELRMRSSLEEIAAGYLPLKQKGRRFWGCCPFHNEKTPSFSIDTQAQLFYCFGCHKGGTVFNFVMEMEHMTFMEAVEYLARRAHMEMPRENAAPGMRQDEERRQRIYEVNREAARYFHECLMREEGAPVLSYFYRRGFNDRDIRAFGLGASPAHKGQMRAFLLERGYDEALQESAGLLVNRGDGRREMFLGRAMFPIIDARGHVLGFGGRALGDEKPKYINTADTPVFNKRYGLYAMNWLRKERNLERAVLVEGYMDTLSLLKYGVQGVVATLGTALTEDQARLLKRYVSTVWISYDGDAAGQKAAIRALDIFEPTDMEAFVLDYPEGMDPDDFIRTQGREGFEKLKKYSAMEYRMLRAADGMNLETQEDLSRYAMQCCAILTRVKRPIELEDLLRKLSARTGYDTEVLKRQVEQSGGTPQMVRRMPPPRRERADRLPPVSPAQQQLLSLLCAELLPEGTVTADDFSEDSFRRAAQWVLSGRKISAYLDQLDDAAQRDQLLTAVNAETLPGDGDTALLQAQQCLKTLRMERLSQRQKDIAQEIKTASTQRKQELYEQMGRINQELETLTGHKE